MSVYRRLRQVFAVAVLMLVTVIVHGADWSLDQLMQRLARVEVDRATFSETKYLAMLNRPVESSGELYYAAPHRLEKRTLLPKPETLILDRGALVIERGRKKRHLSLQQHPELAAFIDSIRATLAGDRAALERNYRLSLDGTAEQWTLLLIPLDANILAVVERIRMTGTGDAVQRIDIIQADGNYSVMQIQRLNDP
jgi:Outer membrane lipoprotein carrier protein LolA-like